MLSLPPASEIHMIVVDAAQMYDFLPRPLVMSDVCTLVKQLHQLSHPSSLYRMLLLWRARMGTTEWCTHRWGSLTCDSKHCPGVNRKTGSCTVHTHSIVIFFAVASHAYYLPTEGGLLDEKSEASERGSERAAKH